MSRFFEADAFAGKLAVHSAVAIRGHLKDRFRDGGSTGLLLRRHMLDLILVQRQSVVFLRAARTPACFQAAALPQPPLNINWWGNEKHITGNGHGAQRERAYLRDKRFPWAFNFHAKAHSGKIVIKYIIF